MMKFVDFIILPDKIHLARPFPLDTKSLTGQEKPKKKKFPFLDFLAVLVCLGIVFSFCTLWVKANSSASAKVQFTADTILSLKEISDGDLYIARDSKCSSLTVSGPNLTVSGIPDGSSFILKTPQHSNALKITPLAGTLGLTFSSSNLATSTGTISQWALDGFGSTRVAHIVGTPKANTWYAIKVNGILFNSFQSNDLGEVFYTYDDEFSSSKAKVFTIKEDLTRGPVPISPPVPILPPGGSVPILSPVGIEGIGNVCQNLGGEIRRTFESGQLVKVAFPSHSIKGTVVVKIEPKDRTEVIKTNPLPQNTQIIGDLVADFKALFRGEELEKFARVVPITFTYSDEQVKEAGVDETTLKIYRWNKEAKEWESLETKIDTRFNRLTAYTTRFTLFAVMGETREELIEKPIEEMTIEEVKAKILEIQQKIIVLLTQLIQLIQEEITRLQAQLP